MNTGKTLFSQLMDFLYLLVAIAEKELKIDRSMGEILHILSSGLFEKPPFLQAFARKRTTISEGFALTSYFCSTSNGTVLIYNLKFTI